MSLMYAKYLDFGFSKNDRVLDYLKLNIIIASYNMFYQRERK